MAPEPPAACTIIARNYLSYATILAESYLRHSPGARFYILVVDPLPPEAPVPKDVRVITPRELDLPSYFEMCLKYDVTELCTAVKPALLSLLLSRYQEPSVVYLDPDILITRPLRELNDEMASADVVLIPHLLDPIPRDGLKPTEEDILVAGAYNLGFLAVKASPMTTRLLEWWSGHLAEGCLAEPSRGLFVDQRWIDLVPGLFPSVALLRDETYDVAYWNLHSRNLECRGEDFVVGGRPLAFFHFSGFDPRNPRALSRHQTRTRVAERSALADLLDLYANLHRTHGYDISTQWAYGYSQFSNGVPVNLVFRRAYLALDQKRRMLFGDPFSVDGDDCFFHWATQPRRELGGLSPFLDTLYGIRTDLHAEFRDPRRGDRSAFLEWARSRGPGEMDYPAEIVLPPRRRAMTPSARPGAVDTGPTGSAGGSGPLAVRGINVVGYFRDETGLGAVARGHVSAFRSLGVPVALKDVSSLSPHRSEDPTFTTFDTEHDHPVNLVCVNADQHFVVASHVGDAFFRNRFNIALWFWELEEFPEEWRDRFSQYDEIWAASSFIADALAPVSPVPIVRMPPVLAGEEVGDRELGRKRLRVGAHDFVWLFVFDFRSHCPRKNPLGLIEAFKKAYAPSESATLVIKCVNSECDQEAFRSMHAAARGHRISIYDGYQTARDMRDLMAACDGYASLHRSEGLGVPLANAMWHGKPVVATGWSGNTDFMDVSNSFPIRYELVKLAHDVGPYRAGSTWAEPSVDHAAELLRLVSEGTVEVKARAKAGQRTIGTLYSVGAVAVSLERRLETISRLRSRARFERRPRPASDRYAHRPALPAMDLRTSQHGWLGRLGKRIVGFLLKYHTFHQQRVNVILSNSIASLSERIQDLSEEMDRASVETGEKLDLAMRTASECDSRLRHALSRLEPGDGKDESREREKGVLASLEASVQHAARPAPLQEPAEKTHATPREPAESGQIVLDLTTRLQKIGRKLARLAGRSVPPQGP
jgi:glycosyltransferase involved in cell wall biosynthesis